MTIKPQLSLRQRQRLALSPGLRTGMHLLRLPTLDLIDAIEAEAADNPFLIHDDLRPRGGALAGPAFDFALNTVVATRSLIEDLHSQIGAMTLPPQVRAIAEYLAGDLRDDGYLDAALEEIATTLDLPLPLIEAGLAALQSCDPAGVGARSLAECLTLQLIDRGTAPDLAQRTIGLLHLFAIEDWRTLRRDLGLERPALLRLAGMIRELVPRPVVQSSGPDSYLLPDLMLEPSNSGSFTVQLGIALASRVRINLPLVAASKASGGSFATDRQARAEAMMQALRFRGETLLRIGRMIAERQYRFFALGPDHLAPMSRSELAAALGLHGSTVGRAVASKALEVGGRIYPLALFFSNPLPADGNASIAAFVVQRRISQLIEQETATAPLTDAAICAALRATGVDIARRTVAKYRGCMRIPSSFARRGRKAPHRSRPRCSGDEGNQRD